MEQYFISPFVCSFIREYRYTEESLPKCSHFPETLIFLFHLVCAITLWIWVWNSRPNETAQIKVAADVLFAKWLVCTRCLWHRCLINMSTTLWYNSSSALKFRRLFIALPFIYCWMNHAVHRLVSSLVVWSFVLQDLTLKHGWRTGAIIPELRKEIKIMNTEQYMHMMAWLQALTGLIEQMQVRGALWKTFVFVFCFLPPFWKVLGVTSVHFSPTGPQGSSISGCRRGVDQRKRSHEVMEMTTLAIKTSSDHLSRSCRTSSWWYECVSLAGHRQRISSTVSSGVSSGRTTTPPTSHVVSRASLTSTWPPSAACSTTTSSTPSSLAVLPCSTSPPSGPKTVLAVRQHQSWLESEDFKKIQARIERLLSQT